MRARFSDWVFDAEARELRRGAEPVRLSPKAFDLLGLLIGRSPDAVSKAEIHEHVWPATFVSASSLTKLVTEIRSALTDNPRRPRFVRTVPRFGYAFAGALAEDGSEPASRTVGARARLVWNGRALLLFGGENEIGRTEETALQIDAPTISRRHARITFDGNRATLEDLGSKNGTFLRGARLDAPIVLRYGDRLHLGSEAMLFERMIDPRQTPTETGGPD